MEHDIQLAACVCCVVAASAHGPTDHYLTRPSAVDIDRQTTLHTHDAHVRQTMIDKHNVIINAAFDKR